MSRRHFIAGFFLCLTPFPLIVREHSRCLAAAEADAPAAIETLEQVGAILTRDGEGLVFEVRFPVSGASADKNNAAIAALAGLARVRSVVLAGSGATDRSLEKLGSLTTLRNLDLRDCPLTNAGLSHLVTLCDLTALRLSGKSGATTIDDVGLEHIGKLTHLRALLLDYLWISEVGLRKLSDLTQLEELTLAQTLVRDDAIAPIARFSKLRKVRLARTGITASGVEELMKLENLEDLDLSEASQITDEALMYVGRLKGLKRLNLWRVPVGDKGIEHLVELTKLEWLNLDDTATSDKGLTALVGMKNLTFLYLGSTAVSDLGLQHLTGLKALKDLSLRRTAVSKEGAERLQKQLPAAKIRLNYIEGQ